MHQNRMSAIASKVGVPSAVGKSTQLIRITSVTPAAE